MHAHSLSCVQFWTEDQTPLSMGFPRQEYLSGLPFPSPDLPDPGIEAESPVLGGGFFTPESPGKLLLVS